MLHKILRFITEGINMPVTPVRWCKFVIWTFVLIIAGAVALVFIVDPHYRYRLPVFYDTVYYEIYATAPRLLNDIDYDTLFIGSSMTRNIFVNDINNTLGVDSIKLAASGATTIDLVKFADISIEAKGDHLKQIFFSLDIYSLNKPDAHYRDFEYLYRDDLKEEYRYWFSRATYSNMYYLLKRKLRPKKKRQHQTDFNRMFSTEYDGMRFGWEEIMADAVYNESIHHTQTPANPEVFERNLNEVLLPLIEGNPQLQFYIYLAPYHIYTYCQSEQFNEADALLGQRLRVMNELLKFDNVRLYDYQADQSLVCTDDFYSDVQHFSSGAGRLLLQKLAAEQRRIATPEEAAANDRELRALIAGQMPKYYTDMTDYKSRKK